MDIQSSVGAAAALRKHPHKTNHCVRIVSGSCQDFVRVVSVWCQDCVRVVQG